MPLAISSVRALIESVTGKMITRAGFTRLSSRRNSPFLFYFIIATLALMVLVQALILLSLTGQQEEPLRLEERRRLFIGANLYNNEAILPHFQRELLLFLDQDTDGPRDVYICIYENGSKDDTKRLLKELEKELTLRHIESAIELDPQPKLFQERMSYLAHVRNRVLDRFYELQTSKKLHFDYLIFLNDVDWTVHDLRRLMRSRSTLDFDAICGMDYEWLFYDTLVTRELPPPLLSQFYPSEDTLVQSSQNHGWEATFNPNPEDDSHYGWPLDPVYPHFRFNTTLSALSSSDGLVPVYSCWNGLIIVRTEPLYKHHVRFRSLSILPENNGEQRTYDASECCLLIADLHRWGYHRILMHTRVRLSYSANGWWWTQLVMPWWQTLWWSWKHHPEVPLAQSKRFQDMTKSQRQASNHSYWDRLCIQPNSWNRLEAQQL